MLTMLLRADRSLIDLETEVAGLQASANPLDHLTAACVISLFSDRRASADDPVDRGADRRGWAGDALSPITGDRIGSRLWLLRREKQTEETRRRAIDYASEALAWVVDDGHATRIDVVAEWAREGVLGLCVRLDLPSGDVFTTSFEAPLNAL